MASNKLTAKDGPLSICNAEGTTLRMAQLRLLEILREFDRICIKHNIQYFLSGGTCLGAIRHGGFIPWDDDIDIDVWHTDYKKLKSILQRELPNWIKVQTPETDQGYYHFYMRLVDINSHLEYQDNFVRRKMKFTGLFIDILPLNHSFSYKARGFINRRLRLAYSMSRVGAKNKYNEFISHIFLPFYKLLWFIYHLLSNISPREKVSHALPSIHNPELKYSNCFPPSRIKFEGHEFWGPAKPHEYLEGLYGKNYMDIPPQSKRISHASIIQFTSD